MKTAQNFRSYKKIFLTKVLKIEILHINFISIYLFNWILFYFSVENRPR